MPRPLGLTAAVLGAAVLASACGSPPPATTTPTVLPPVPAAASPLASPTSSPTLLPTLPPATPTPMPLVVYGTAGDGVSLRSAPGSAAERIKVLPEGTVVTPLGEEQQADGRAWRRVRDPENAEGWVAADFLVDPATATAQPAPTGTPRPPAAGPTGAAATSVAPTRAAPTSVAPPRPVPELRPTFTPATAPAPAPKPAPAPPGPTAAVPTKPTGPAPTAPPATRTPQRL